MLFSFMELSNVFIINTMIVLGFKPKKRLPLKSSLEYFMAGIVGFEPTKWQVQSLLPYRLAISQ